MGIKSWLIVGIGTLVAVGAIWVKKKRDAEEFERVQKIIDEVDKTVSPEHDDTKELAEMNEDIEVAFRDMGLDKEADAFVDATKAIDAINSEIKKEIGCDPEKACEAIIMENGETAKEWIDRCFSKAKEDDEEKLKALHEEKEQDPEAWAKSQEEQKKKDEESWRRKVKKAVEQKNWRRLEDLFDEKYAGGPWHPSPASVFSAACSDGVISTEILKMAEDHFGKLWCYSGD